MVACRLSISIDYPWLIHKYQWISMNNPWIGTKLIWFRDANSEYMFVRMEKRDFPFEGETRREGWKQSMKTDVIQKSMKILGNYKNHSTITEAIRIQWKSSDNKTPAWNRVQVSMGAAGLTYKNLSLQVCRVRVFSFKGNNCICKAL